MSSEEEHPDARPMTPLMPVAPLFDPDAAMAPHPLPPSGLLRKVLRAAQVLFALWLFLSAIVVLKHGAAALAPVLSGSFLTDSAASTLGFGWLGAMLVMSGSPVAVSAIALLDGGVVDQVGAFTMLTGSRLGASLVVLVVAGIYSVRNKPGTGVRTAATSIGIFALLLTALVYLPALIIAIPLLEGRVLHRVLPDGSFQVPDVIDVITGWFVHAIDDHVPGRLLFLVGLALLLISVRIIDRALPEATDTARLEENQDWRDRRWVMFGVGSLVALVTMSVSVALTVLVPAVAKGHFKRSQVIAYIMGANITTLGDTLLTAVLIGNSDGVAVVLAELVATTCITLVLMCLFYARVTRGLVRLTDWMLASKYRMLGFVGVLALAPLTLVLAF